MEESVRIAEELTVRTERILRRMEEQWRQIVPERYIQPPPSRGETGVLQEELSNEEKLQNEIEVTKEDLKEIPYEAAVGEARVVELTNRIDIRDEKEVLLADHNADAIRLMRMQISRLEKEIAALHSSRQFQETEMGPVKNISLLDIVSSQSASPEKYKQSDVECSAKNVTFLRKIDDPKSDRTFILKNELIQTERLVESGFKTAKEINDRLELLKHKKRHKNSSAVQVQMKEKKRDSAKDDQLLRSLNEKLSAFFQEPSCTTGLCQKNKQHNYGSANVEVICHAESVLSPASKLTTQLLPNIDIPGVLTLCQLPNVNISPLKTDVAPKPVNTGVKIIHHDIPTSGNADNSEQEFLDSQVLQSILDMKNNNSYNYPNKVNASSQTLKAHRESFDSIGSKTKMLTDLFNEKVLTGQSLEKRLKSDLADLAEKVHSSRLKCQQREFNRPKSSLSQRTISTIAGTNSRNILKSSESIENDKIEVSYVSDFEADSCVDDIPDESAPNTGEENYVTKFLKIPSSERPSSSPLSRTYMSVSHGVSNKIRPITAPVVSSLSLHPSSGSFIDEQIKRLGLNSSAVDQKRVGSKQSKKSSTLGKYLIMDKLESSKINLIVPEIVVKLSDSHDIIRSSKLETNVKCDQEVQTCNDAKRASEENVTPVIEKLNGNFERTQLLLDRMSQKQKNSFNTSSEILDNLHRRYEGPRGNKFGNSDKRRQVDEKGINNLRKPNINVVETKNCDSNNSKKRRRIKVPLQQLHKPQAVISEGEIDDCDSCRSVGELLNSNSK